MSQYQWADVVTYVKPFVKGLPTSTIDTQTCDLVDSIIWKFWFWKWSMTNLTAISWVDGQQDYSITDGDFYRLYRARFTRTDTTPNIVREKDVVNFISPNLEQTGTIESILSVSYNYEVGKLRLEKSASVPSGVAVQIDGDYQRTHTKITTTATNLVFPDYYFEVAVEGLKWKYYDLMGSDQAGAVQVDKSSRKATYTGQRAVFYQALTQMAEAEGMGQGDASRFPDDGLGAARVTNPGIFAWS